MAENRIEGIGHQVKGAVKEGIGTVIGDAKLVADGTAEREVGNAQNVPKAAGDQVLGVDTDRIGGIGHQVKGALKQSFGALIGSPKLEASGLAEREAGKAQNAAGSARDVARETADTDLGTEATIKTDAAPEKPSE